MKLKTRMVLAIGSVLTAVLVLSFLFVVNSQKAQADSLYYNQAKSVSDSLRLVRKVIAGHGGVFVKEKDGVSVNPYLTKIPGVPAEIKNIKGEKFALVNGFSFLQEMSQVSRKDGNVSFSYRSPRENPFNPANTPTEEELVILKQLKNGDITEHYTKTKDKDGKLAYVYSSGMSTDPYCLNCHPKFEVGKSEGMMSVSLPIAEAEARNQANMLNLAYIFAGVLVLMIGITYWLASRISAPIKQLAEMADKVSKGELDVTIDLNRKDEIGELAEAFNRMVASIKILSM